MRHSVCVCVCVCEGGCLYVVTCICSSLINLTLAHARGYGTHRVCQSLCLLPGNGQKRQVK